MTIFTSNLPSDKDLIRALGSVAVPLPLFTDVCFSGVPSGDGDPAPVVAIERKKPGDLCQCLNDGRLVAQLRKSKESGADVLVVIVEGRVRRNPDDGLLEMPVWGFSPRSGKRAELWSPVLPTTTYNRWCQSLFEFERLAGVYVIRSESVQETAAIILGLWAWFQKPDDWHQSLKQLYKPPPPTVQLVRPSLVRRVASELKGVGWERSAEVASRFRSVGEMVAASEKDWLSIPGIGKKLAKSIVAEMRGGG